MAISTTLTTMLFLSLLLLPRCRLAGSADDISGDWDDADNTDEQKRSNQRQKTVSVITDAVYITKNSSDFHIYEIARDDHEKINNIRRMNNKKSKNWIRKRCLWKCQRSNQMCKQQMKSELKKGRRYCGICMAQCGIPQRPIGR